MSNSKKAVDAAVVILVAAVIAEAEAHTYSVSRVYEAYNQATGKNDAPETCPSCLIARVKELKKWYGDLPKKDKVKDLEVTEDEVTVPTYEGLVEKFQINQEDAAQEMEGLTMLITSKDADLSEDEVKLLAQRSEDLTAANIQYNDPGAAFFSGPAKGVTRHPVTEGLPFDFTPGKDDVNKGVIAMADGSKAKAGTHTTADGTTFVVQANGNARIHAEDLT